MSNDEEASVSATARVNLDRLAEGVAHWNTWRRSNRQRVDLDGVDLSVRDLKGVDLAGASLRGADLSGCDLTDANLGKADLAGANLARTTLSGTNLTHANLEGATLTGCRGDGSNLNHVIASRADLRYALFRRGRAQAARFHEASLRDTSFVSFDFTGAVMQWTDLRGAHLHSTTMDGVEVMGARLGGTTLVDLVYGEQHDALRDSASRVEITGHDRVLNWGLLRAIGSFPLFEVSYLALAASLATVITIGYLNTHQPADLNYPIPLPERAVFLLISSVLLVLGTTLYRVACPRRVQEFSETSWVEGHGHPRLMYLGESFRRRFLQWPTAIATIAGGAIGVWLLIDRLVVAFQYALTQL